MLSLLPTNALNPWMKHEGEWIIEDVHSPIDSWEVEEEGGALLYFKPEVSLHALELVWADPQILV